MTGKAILPAVLTIALGALTAAPAYAAPRPNAGVWKGRQASGVKLPVSFRLQSGKVLRFRSDGYLVWNCSDGSTYEHRFFMVASATVHRSGGRYRFRGKRTLHPGGARTTAYLRGSFSSSRRARGALVIKRAGCGSFRTRWSAKGPEARRKPSGGGGGGGNDGCRIYCGPDGIPNTPDDSLPIAPPVSSTSHQTGPRPGTTETVFAQPRMP